MTKTFQDEKLFRISNFGHWKLFDICDLKFVIFELSTKQISSGDNQGLELWEGFSTYAKNNRSSKMVWLFTCL